MPQSAINQQCQENVKHRGYIYDNFYNMTGRYEVTKTCSLGLSSIVFNFQLHQREEFIPCNMKKNFCPFTVYHEDFCRSAIVFNWQILQILNVYVIYIYIYIFKPEDFGFQKNTNTLSNNFSTYHTYKHLILNIFMWRLFYFLENTSQSFVLIKLI